MLKQIRLIALVCVLFSSVIVSCSDDKESGGGVPAVGKVNATIDGKSWEGTNGTGILISTSGIQTLTVGGSKVDLSNPSNIELIAIVVYSATGGTISAGDYTIESTSVPKGQITYTVGTSAQNTWVASKGTVTITKITDTNFQGTFSGTLTKQGTSETKTITNGGFNVNKTNF